MWIYRLPCILVKQWLKSEKKTGNGMSSENRGKTMRILNLCCSSKSDLISFSSSSWLFPPLYFQLRLQHFILDWMLFPKRDLRWATSFKKDCVWLGATKVVKVMKIHTIIHTFSFLQLCTLSWETCFFNGEKQEKTYPWNGSSCFFFLPLISLLLLFFKLTWV